MREVELDLGPYAPYEPAPGVGRWRFDKSLPLTTSGHLRVVALGVGSAFAGANYQSNLIIIKGKTALFVDLGTLAVLRLRELGVTCNDIEHVLITHSHADHIGSLNMVAGILAALNARHESGLGQRIEVSLVGGQIWAQATEYTHYLLTGKIPGRSNLGHPLIPAAYRIFQTADGWIGLIGLSAEAKDVFFALVGRPEMAMDPRFDALLLSPEELKSLLAELEPIFLEKTTNEWCELLKEAGARFARVRNYAEVVADEGVWENEDFVEVKDASGESQRVVGTPIRMSATPLQPSATAPDLGQHSDEILSEVGYSAAQIEEFRAAGTG